MYEMSVAEKLSCPPQRHGQSGAMRAFFLITCLLSACSPEWQLPKAVTPPVIELPSAVGRLNPAEAAAWLASHPDAQIVDLRMEEELAREGRLPGAAHVDFFHRAALERHLQGIAKDKPCMIYCALGGRAERVAVQMHSAGFSQVFVLEGGTDAWLKSGRTLSK